MQKVKKRIGVFMVAACLGTVALAHGGVKNAADVARFAAQTPALFNAPESDPKTEALPAIWERFEDFTTKAQETARLAHGLAQTLETKADLDAGLTQLGASCKACHKEYRK